MKFNIANLLMLTLVVGLSIALVVSRHRAKPDVLNSSLDWNQLKRNTQTVEIIRSFDDESWTLNEKQNDAIWQWIKNNRDLYTGRPRMTLKGLVFDEYQVVFRVEDGISIRFPVHTQKDKKLDEFESLFIKPDDPKGNLKEASARFWEDPVDEPD